VPLKPSFGMSIMSPRLADDVVFAGGIGAVSVAVQLSKDGDKVATKELWRNSGNTATSLSPINMTPLIVDGTIYGFDQPGQLRAVELKTGKRLWGTLEPLSTQKPLNSGTGFLVKNGERYWIFNERGELILCKLNREKYEELGRAKLLEPTGPCFGRDVVWSHPAFANRCVYSRNDKEIV
jgi:outer membrane protein assembly factor BamB